MKKIFITLLMVIVCTGLISGCNGNESNTDSGSAPSYKGESTASVPTLDQVISGTWSLYAGYDQNGGLAYTSSDSAQYSFTFNADNVFSGVYRQGDGYVDATFSGTYDVSDSKAVYQNPYDWNYYASIQKDSIADSGESTLLGKFGEQGLYMTFKFRELEGEKLLYEENQRLYFKR